MDMVAHTSECSLDGLPFQDNHSSAIGQRTKASSPRADFSEKTPRTLLSHLRVPVGVNKVERDAEPKPAFTITHDDRCPSRVTPQKLGDVRRPASPPPEHFGVSHRQIAIEEVFPEPPNAVRRTSVAGYDGLAVDQNLSFPIVEDDTIVDEPSYLFRAEKHRDVVHNRPPRSIVTEHHQCSNQSRFRIPP